MTPEEQADLDKRLKPMPFWCWWGLHKWSVPYNSPLNGSKVKYQKCLRCGRERMYV